ncbi:hypothetical protein [Actinotalea sp. C106]|uniref:hypothetical protein n=1 Tax=Actinotalea sp. C106 TaxID=2908644 RepID=UPI002027904A|nr:hypothetical protein [Actinotalea sp. C106]
MSAVPYSMHFAPEGELLESARECEAEVFLRWYGNTREQLVEEYGPYDDASAFLAIADQGGDVVGAVRLLAPGGRAGLKTLTDVAAPPWSVPGARVASAAGLDLGSTWEIATLGVRRQDRADGLRLSLALYHGLIAVCRANGMSSFVAVLDERVRRLLHSVGLLTQVLPGTSTAPYLGSAASTPVFARCAPVLDNQRQQFPDAYRLVTLGVGLDGVTVPPAEAFRLHDRLRAPDDLSTTSLAAVPSDLALLTERV